MSRLLDDDKDDLLTSRRQERELTLSPGAILGIFLGLVLACGAFFGLGYKLGTGSRPAGIAASNSAASEPSDSGSGVSLSAGSASQTKPAAGSLLAEPGPVAASVPGPAPASGAAGADGAPAGGKGASTNPASAARTATVPAATVAAVPQEDPGRMPRSAPSETGNATGASSSFVVQVAAVSHQEDADLLVNALRSKGYTVAARPEPGDRLVHIQVGPFSNRKEADAMRLRLAADGYNAFIK